jgi:hypothetical protein
MMHWAETSLLVWVAAVTVGTPCPVQDESQGLWQRLPDMAVPRWEAGLVVFEDRLYLTGGSSNDAASQPGMWVCHVP